MTLSITKTGYDYGLAIQFKATAYIYQIYLQNICKYVTK